MTRVPTSNAQWWSLAGDMWNELDNLRELWEGTDRECYCRDLIERYERMEGIL